MSKGIEKIDVGGVNCYLLEADDGFVLIDTGFPAKRMFLDVVLKKALNKPGEVPNKLKLIILTHGDSYHAGNRKSKPDKMSFTFRLALLLSVRIVFLTRLSPIFTYMTDKISLRLVCLQR